jgi:endonuclease/exonuclease/phosphatase family metal-dependent hydrolase
VGSFNITGVNNDGGASGDEKIWRERRGKVVDQILAQRIDVLGVQEANQSTVYKDRLTYGETQYLDLKGALNARGRNFALTNSNAYNCVTPRSTYKCVTKDQGATGDNRILYDTDRVTLVRQGGLTFKDYATGKPRRYLAWAILKMKSSGKQFLFTNTHLDPYSIPARKNQWDEMIAKINSIKGYLPVVAVGDFNTSKFSEYASTYLPRMRNNGYGDVLNQKYRETVLSQPRAQSVRRAWVNSYNSWSRKVPNYGYEEGSRNKIGNGIDWVFASNNVPVKSWEVVVDMNTTTLQLRGVIPSDHALVRATLILP